MDQGQVVPIVNRTHYRTNCPMIALCVLNNHAVDMLKSNDHMKALAILFDTIATLPYHIECQKTTPRPFGSLGTHQQGCPAGYSLHTRTVEIGEGGKDSRSLVYDKAIEMHSASHHSPRMDLDAHKCITKYQLAVLWFNLALTQHLIASKTPKESVSLMVEALNGYKLAFDNLFAYQIYQDPLQTDGLI